MKNEHEKKLYIDELLSGYVDGVLNQRHYTEIKRLIQHDPLLAEQLEVMRNQRKVLHSLPTETAPDTIVEDVKAILERQYILNGLPNTNTEKADGAKRIFRRIAAVAAMVLIPLGLLTYVVTQILLPQGSKEPNSGMVARLNEQPKDNYLADAVKKNDTVVAADVKFKESPMPLAEIDRSEFKKLPEEALDYVLPDQYAFKGLLKLQAADKSVVNSFIQKRLYTLGVIDNVTSNHGQDKDRYVVTIHQDKLATLMSDMKQLWPRCQTQTLILKPNSPPDEQIHIQSVQPSQIVTLSGNRYEKSFLEQANMFAANNAQPAQMLFEDSRLAVADAGNDTPANPGQPILTWDKESKVITSKIEAVNEDKDSWDVTLIIEVTQAQETSKPQTQESEDK